MEDDKKPLSHGTFADDPQTPEGKYLVQRRDGSVVEWPSFVLGARDPIAPAALRAYANKVYWILKTQALLAEKLKLSWEYHAGILRRADEFDAYRAEHGDADPGAGRHRTDDPETVAKMRRGRSA